MKFAGRIHDVAITLRQGESKLFRLPPMTSGNVVIGATIPIEPATPALRRRASGPAVSGLNLHGAPLAPGTVGNVRGSSPTTPSEPIHIAEAKDLTLQLIRSGVVQVQGKAKVVHRARGYSDEWFLRVSRTRLVPSSRNYQIRMVYPSGLLRLRREVPMAFFRNGFNRNWNDHQYIRFALNNTTMSISFDPDFAALYDLHQIDLDVSVYGELNPVGDSLVYFHDIRSKSIEFRAGGDGRFPYFGLRIQCEGSGPEEVSVLGHGINFGENDLWIDIKFDLTSWGRLGWDPRHINTPLFKWIRNVGHGLGKRVGAAGKIKQAIYQALYSLQSANNNAFARTLSPWLTGGNREIIEVGYRKRDDTMLVDYVGPRYVPRAQSRTAGTTVTASPRSGTVRWTQEMRVAPPLFDVPLETPDNQAGRPSTTPNPLPSTWRRPLTTTTGGMENKFDHVVVLMMENRSFDQVLGYLSRDRGKAGVSGLAPAGTSEAADQVNVYKDRVYAPRHITNTAWPSIGTPSPSHEFGAVLSQMSDGMAHFVSNYAKRVGETPALLQRVMDYYDDKDLKAYAFLAKEFAICDHWFCAHVGATWPNRFITFTGRLNRDPDGEPEYLSSDVKRLQPIETPTIFDHLTDRGVSWKCFEHGYSFIRMYGRYTFDIENVVDFRDPTKGFVATAKNGRLPNVTWIEPDYIDLPPGNDDHPPADMADGQALVSKVVQALLKSPQWERTLLIITYDEHGGFYDHVFPPEAQPLLPPHQFRQLGPRVPTFIMSHYVARGGVSKTVYDHTSIAATILRRFCSPKPPRLSERADNAADLRNMFVGPSARRRRELLSLASKLSRIGASESGTRRFARSASTRARTLPSILPGTQKDLDFHEALRFARMFTGMASA